MPMGNIRSDTRGETDRRACHRHLPARAVPLILHHAHVQSTYSVFSGRIATRLPTSSGPPAAAAPPSGSTTASDAAVAFTSTFFLFFSAPLASFLAALHIAFLQRLSTMMINDLYWYTIL